MRRIVAYWSPLMIGHMDAWGVTLIIAAACTLVHGAATVERLGLLLTLAGTAWLAFAVNDYFDAPFDAQDAEKRARNFFATRRFSPLLAAMLFGIAIALLFAGYCAHGWRGLLVFIVTIIAMWAYSAPPVRLKSRPGIDLLMHGVFVQTAPYFVCLFLLGSDWLTLDYVLLVAFFLSSLAAQLEQQTRDYDIDARTEGNFTTTIGRRLAVWLMRGASFGMMALLVTAFLSRLIPLYFVPFGVITLPLMLHRFIRRADEPRSQRLIIALLIVALLYTGGIWSAAAWLHSGGGGLPPGFVVEP